MTGRIARLVRRAGLDRTRCRGRRPKLLPMSREDERIQAELHRRRQERRRQQETPS